MNLTTALPSKQTAVLMRPPTCDSILKSGRRARKNCGARATHFDPTRKLNLCGLHRQDVLGALAGTGIPWYADPVFGCDTVGHHDRKVRRVVDGVAMCFDCSGDYAIAVEMKREAA